MKVLVMLAAYNGGDFIAEQIDSIMSQTDVSIEILISDDHSSDNTIDIVNELISRNLPIKLIQRKTKTGSAAKNFMSLIQSLENADAFDAFAFSDQDDIWLPNKLSSAIKCFKENNADLYMSNLIMWNQHTGTKTIIKKHQSQKKFDFLFEGGSAGCTYVFNPALFHVIRNTVSSLNYEHWKGFSHDWLVYFIARVNGFKVFIDSEPHILYRIHGNNLHGHLNTLSIKSITARLDLVRRGWYMDHINGFMPLLKVGTKEHEIYSMYKKSWISRIFVVAKYNVNLMRSSLKFLQFATLSLIPQKKVKSDV